VHTLLLCAIVAVLCAGSPTAPVQRLAVEGPPLPFDKAQIRAANYILEDEEEGLLFVEEDWSRMQGYIAQPPFTTRPQEKGLRMITIAHLPTTRCLATF